MYFMVFYHDTTYREVGWKISLPLISNTVFICLFSTLCVNFCSTFLNKKLGKEVYTAHQKWEEIQFTLRGYLLLLILYTFSRSPLAQEQVQECSQSSMSVTKKTSKVCSVRVTCCGLGPYSAKGCSYTYCQVFKCQPWCAGCASTGKPLTRQAVL